MSSDNNSFTIDDRRRSRSGRRADERRKAELARRRSPRMRTLKGAQIIVPAGSSVACIVRNISETGACLQLQTPVFLSHTFDLVFDDPDWSRRSCRVVWREALLMGVEFTTRESEGGPIRRALQRLLSGKRG
ncbi:MAG: PilZ domain-containing protein [Bauldia sp.]